MENGGPRVQGAVMAKAIMIQGTMSNAGKSFLVAGLCRLFQRDGFRVAPFKSQNMALNSYVTADGCEIGRAQAVQAEACGLLPDVRMNPILLKPVTDMGSQVILMGKSAGIMKADEYYRKKKEYIPLIRDAYESLAAENDIIVIEGAGSPVELNLKENDIVNMGMAEIADSPVILVGDIDRGGVFAQLYGTCALLEPHEKERIVGLIINKFRGDIGLLTGGLETLEQLTGKRVLGVVPYMDVRMEAEDSLADCLQEKPSGDGTPAGIDIAVIRFPRISNFTDFQPLSGEPGVRVRYVGTMDELGSPDLIILPGTRSTMKDLGWFRECGLMEAVLGIHGKGTPVLGICGGYQMLGTRIEDPDGQEGSGFMAGLCLLPAVTVFKAEKVTRQAAGRTAVTGILSLDGLPLEGYEVHQGRTFSDGASPFAVLDGAADGCVSGLVFGTYLHGLFDSDPFRRSFLEWLAVRKGVSLPDSGLNYRTGRGRQYDRAAEILRSSIDLEAVYRFMGIQ